MKNESQKLLWLGAIDRRALRRNVLRARYVHAEIQAKQRRDDPAHERVEPARNALFAREPVGFLIAHRPEAIGVSGRAERVRRSNEHHRQDHGTYEEGCRRRGGDGSLRAQGRREERKGEEKEKLAEAQDRAEEKAQDVADLERRT